jgi:hypothetical protein
VSPNAPGQDRRRHLEQGCARCGRSSARAANWSEGLLCRTCLDRATRTRGVCLGCHVDRLLPGLSRTGAPICRDCAGITRSFTCTRCPAEDHLRAGLCRRCDLTARLRVLLDDGTGRIHPPLVPLFDRLRAMPNPASGLNWIWHPGPKAMLADLACGRLPVTHAAFDKLPNGPAAAYLRDLLMACDILPPADRHLLLFNRWTDLFIAKTTDPGHARTLRRFATWSLLPTVRAKATKTGPSNDGRARHGRNQLTQAAAFLAWLSEHHTTLADTRQADLDTWAVDRPTSIQTNRAFLLWCMTNKSMPTLAIPTRTCPPQRAAPMAPTARIQALHRLLTDPGLPLRSRSAGALVLLYAQPVSKIVGLRVSDITTSPDGQTTLNLGTPPTPVPEPLAALLHAYVQARPNMTTATNPNSEWLFPGRRAGLPIHPRTMTGLLEQAGVPARTSRIAAIRGLVLQLPAPVIADALGYHPTSATRIAAEAGSPWSGYAAGDHSRGPNPRT